MQNFVVGKVSYVFFGKKFFVLSVLPRFCFFAINIELLFYLFTDLVIYTPVGLIELGYCRILINIPCPVILFSSIGETVTRCDVGFYRIMSSQFSSISLEKTRKLI